jgi:hypothetical protein
MGTLCASIQLATNGAVELEPGSFITPESIHCLSGATTCGEVDACVRDTPSEIAACNGKSTGQCAGDILVQCSTPTVTPTRPFYDCAQLGLHCFQGAGGAACGTGTCLPGTTASSCQGDVLTSCFDIGTAAEPGGVLVPTDCSKQHGWAIDFSKGDSCASAPCTSLYADTCGVAGGVAQCMGSGGACNSSASCSGTVVSACTGGKEAHFDCASLGPLTCKDSDLPGFPICVSAGTECDQSVNEPETCEDGVITFCLFGTKATMDCKSYGFSGCTTAMSVAKCTP